MAKKSKAKRQVSIPRRLNILFALIMLLFGGLVMRLAYMQLFNSGFYIEKLTSSSQKVISTSSVRGQIYDAKGVPLVENQVKQVVTFTRSNTMTPQDIKEIAQNLKNYIGVSNIDVSGRDQVDYYLADTAVYEQVVAALPDEDKFDTDGNYLSESTIYANAVASVPEESLSYSDEEKKVIHLFVQMAAASNYTTVNLETDALTTEQVANIISNEEVLAGVDIGSSWTRQVLDTSLASIIGKVSTEKAGLPEEEVDDYLAKGYALNDRVGTSYLEKAYESDLQGISEKKELHLDENGNVEDSTIIQAGEKGKNLKLTIDLDFQNGVNAILNNYFTQELANGGTAYSEGIYAVVMNPNTGAVLAMAGYNHDLETGEMTENALGTVTATFVPGSVVKGATLTAGWEYDLISGNEVLLDQPIYFGSDTSSAINSWFTQYGQMNITAVQAMEYSSNTYMLQIAIKLLGYSGYAPGMVISDEKVDEAMGKLRQVFAQYGLGTETGIDLPNEATGYLPSEGLTIGNYLTEAFGQFDTYTPMQLAQYAATVANGGTRLAPHIVEGIYDNNDTGGMGELKRVIEKTVLNEVPLSDEEMGLIHQGFYQVVNYGSSYTTGKDIAKGAIVPISAKTGTAETFATDAYGNQVSTSNVNVVGYAPSDNPQIAISVVLPHETDLNSNVAQLITRDIVNLYFSQQNQS